MMLRVSTVAIIGLMTVGCGSNSLTYGNLMENQGKYLVQTGQSWTEGQKMVSKGDALIQKGNKELTKADKLALEEKKIRHTGMSNISTGEHLAAEGQKLMSLSEETFAERTKKPAHSETGS